jgi:hypothetical protein
MSDYIVEAVYSLYPSAIRTVGIDENIKCYDSSDNIVSVSFTDIQKEAQNLEAEDISREEAGEAIRASALQKLVENAGLTVEEASELVKL